MDHDSMLSHRFFSMSSASGGGHGLFPRPDVDGDAANRLNCRLPYPQSMHARVAWTQLLPADS